MNRQTTTNQSSSPQVNKSQNLRAKQIDHVEMQTGVEKVSWHFHFGFIFSKEVISFCWPSTLDCFFIVQNSKRTLLHFENKKFNLMLENTFGPLEVQWSSSNLLEELFRLDSPWRRLKTQLSDQLTCQCNLSYIWLNANTCDRAKLLGVHTNMNSSRWWFFVC